MYMFYLNLFVSENHLIFHSIEYLSHIFNSYDAICYSFEVSIFTLEIHHAFVSNI